MAQVRLIKWDLLIHIFEFPSRISYSEHDVSSHIINLKQILSLAELSSVNLIERLLS